MADEAKPDLNHSWDDLEFTSHPSEEHLRVISACEELGGMLAICNETCEEVKKHMFAACEPTSVPIIEVRICFPKRDVALHLRNKRDGLKFLALVCALVTAFDPTECAQVLAMLMEHHLVREDGKCLTVEQLRPLIATIETRCQLSGFASHIVHYEITLCHELRARDHGDGSLSRLGKTPDVEAVVKLVDLLLLLKAEGSRGKPQAVSIYAGRCAPWIAAFLRWWFHTESMIFIDDEKLAVFNKRETQVGIRIPLQTFLSSPKPIKIRAIYSRKEWEDWTFDLGRAKQYSGLVPISTYFQLMLSAFKLDAGQANKAALDAIPYAVLEARNGLTMCSEGCVTRKRWGAPCETTGDIAKVKATLRSQHGLSISSDRFEPFPERADINKILRLVPGCAKKHMKDLYKWKIGMQVYEHPDAVAFLEQERHAAERANWSEGVFETQFTSMAAPGATTKLMEQIAHITATILALSLFRDPEKLLVSPDPFVWQRDGLKPSTVISAMDRTFRKLKACCDVVEWHHVCRLLAGEREEPGWGTIISCGGGQAVWSAITLGGKIPASGESYLRLNWCRGNLYNENNLNKRYRRVIGIDSRTMISNIRQAIPDIPARLTQVNMVTGGTVGLPTRLCSEDERVLECALVRTAAENITGIHANPCGVLKSLASAERLEQCPHGPDTPMDVSVPSIADSEPNTAAALPDVYLCSPDDALPWLLDWAGKADSNDVARQDLSKHLQFVRGVKRPGAVAVVPVSNNSSLRFYALAKPVGAHVAVREHTCVACSVKFCKELGFGILVL
ncbi:hypothetical protein F4677DRAFT_431513 [Hypoxylon crocopeplum]|nr:hypothetical protein F4677DRAFT_431513 [Hypoxylon crocopeplum]